VIACPKNRKLLAALGISILLANEIGLPLSLLSAAAKRSRVILLSKRAIFSKIALRFSMDV